MSATLTALLASLAGAPALPGARCRGRGHLFDDAQPGERVTTTEARHAQAFRLCDGCPALTRCRDWLDATPPGRRPRGVVAGCMVDKRGKVRTPPGPHRGNTNDPTAEGATA